MGSCFSGVPLSDIADELDSGGRPAGGSCANGILSVGGEHIGADGAFILADKCFVPADYYHDMRRGKLRRGNILIVKDGATTGKVGFVDGSLRLPAAVNEHVFRLKVDEAQAVPRYVFYYLLSPWGNREILLDFRGATVGGISQDFPERVRVPLPDLPVQRRIAGILDKADRLRRMRRYALELSDQFLPALFLRMFGDPASNPKAWKTVPLGDVVEIRRGASPRPIDDFLGGMVPWIKIGDATDDSIYIERTAEAVTEAGAAKSVRLKPGALIFANSGSLGFARILKIEGCIHDGWLAFEDYESSYDALFLLGMLNRLTDRFLALAPTGTQQNLNTGIMNAFCVVMPPRRLQNDYGRLVEQHLTSARRAHESLRQAEHLFHSLLNQYFGKED